MWRRMVMEDCIICSSTNETGRPVVEVLCTWRPSVETWGSLLVVGGICSVYLPMASGWYHSHLVSPPWLLWLRPFLEDSSTARQCTGAPNGCTGCMARHRVGPLVQCPRGIEADVNIQDVDMDHDPRYSKKEDGGQRIKSANLWGRKRRDVFWATFLGNKFNISRNLSHFWVDDFSKVAFWWVPCVIVPQTPGRKSRATPHGASLRCIVWSLKW